MSSYVQCTPGFHAWTLLVPPVAPDHVVQLLTNKERLCCIIMDCTILADAVSVTFGRGLLMIWNLCFALHLKRTTLLREHN